MSSIILIDPILSQMRSHQQKSRQASLSSLFQIKEDDDQEWWFGEYQAEIHSLSAFRRLMGPQTKADRAKRSAVFFQSPHLKARQRLGQGIHDRAFDHILGNGVISHHDKRWIEGHLPFRVKVIKRRYFRIAACQEIDVSTSFEDWPNLHFRQDTYVYLRIDTLVVEPEASLVVRGNTIIIDCDTIIFDRRNAKSLSENNQDKCCDFKISILGSETYAFSQSRRLAARDGRKGSAGVNGLKPPIDKNPLSFFGHKNSKTQTCSDDLSKPNHRYKDAIGGQGLPGESGTTGQNGSMAKLADIRINRLIHAGVSSLKLFVQAGAGENGGDGGDGGNGGDGDPPGLGGRGGDGGDGGNGGLASNVFFQIPKKYQSCLEIVSLPSVGGQGGKPGKNGRPGSPLTLPTTNNKIKNKNLMGQPGKDGKNRPKAPVYLIH